MTKKVMTSAVKVDFAAIFTLLQEVQQISRIIVLRSQDPHHFSGAGAQQYFSVNFCKHSVNK
jgi:hypothetical protein